MKTDHFKQKLEEEKKVLMTELRSVGTLKNKNNPEDWQAKPDDVDILRSDANEVGDKIESFDENNAVTQDLEKRLADVDAALDKIEAHAYGICEIGGETIEEDRLEANPAARTCKKHLNERS